MVDNLIKAIYPGNLGLVEMYQFAHKAPVAKVERFTSLLKQNRVKEAIKMLEEFQEKKFHPSIYGLQLSPSYRDPRKKRWMHVILEKAKPYTRTRRGKFERVKGYTGKSKPEFLPKKFKHPASEKELEKNVDVSSVVKKIMQSKYKGMSGRDVNLGSCPGFAGTLRDRVGGKIWESYGASQHHIWVEHKKRHYDAETPNGVSNWWDLPLFKRHRKRKEVHVVMEKARTEGSKDKKLRKRKLSKKEIEKYRKIERKAQTVFPFAEKLGVISGN